MAKKTRKIEVCNDCGVVVLNYEPELDERNPQLIKWGVLKSLDWDKNTEISINDITIIPNGEIKDLIWDAADSSGIHELLGESWWTIKQEKEMLMKEIDVYVDGQHINNQSIEKEFDKVLNEFWTKTQINAYWDKPVDLKKYTDMNYMEIEDSLKKYQENTEFEAKTMKSLEDSTKSIKEIQTFNNIKSKGGR